MSPHDSASYPASWHAQGRPLPGGELRHDFDLFANLRPARHVEGVPALGPGIDLMIVRENTEGFYTDRNMYRGNGELMPTPDVAIALGVFSRRSVTRIVRKAFELASTRRGHVAVVHKANVLADTTGMYRTVAKEIAQEFPAVRWEDFHVDAMAALLVRRPKEFDVIVAENMFGDILSDLAGELAGGIGLAPALNASESHAMAQAVHGAAPDIAGQGKANPIGIMLSASMLVRWLGERYDDPELVSVADRSERAVESTLRDGVCTVDLGGQASTSEFTESVLSRL